jgi:hypothetical protein
MYKKVLSFALAGLLLFCAGWVAPAHAATKEEKQARFAEKVRAGVAKLGTGEAARVRVKLRDKTKLEGYLSEAGPTDFVVVNAKTGASTRVAYHQVKGVQGNNLSTGAKVAIGLSVVVAVLVIWLVFENYG